MNKAEREKAEHDRKRRVAWETKNTPEQIKEADNERLARLRLKFRLLGHIERSRSLKTGIDDISAELRYSQEKLHWRARQAAMAFIQKEKHRNKVEARCVQLAHSFMRGTPYARAEVTCWSHPNFGRVVDILTEIYAKMDVFPPLQRFEQWVQAANKHLKHSLKKQEEKK